MSAPRRRRNICAIERRTDARSFQAGLAGVGPACCMALLARPAPHIFHLMKIFSDACDFFCARANHGVDTNDISFKIGTFKWGSKP
jgi:hypothetical protein